MTITMKCPRCSSYGLFHLDRVTLDELIHNGWKYLIREVCNNCGYNQAYFINAKGDKRSKELEV